MPKASVNETFAAALDALVEQIKQDRSILAAILCGSLSHDKVWAKSDIDLALITIDDRKLDRTSISLSADGINVHAFLMQRTEFRRVVEGTIRNWFMHSLLAKGRLLYSQDDTIADLFSGLTAVGERDRQLALLHAATAALPSIYKAHKWLVTRSDLDYTALWILYAATPLARIEVLEAHQIADREVIPQAMKLNPSFFKIIYTDLLNAKKTRKAIDAALAAVDAYVAARARTVFALVLDYLRDAGDVRSCTEIEYHFGRSFGIDGVTTVCEYLADEGIIGKAAATARLTKRSNVDVQEMAFFAHD
jgi:predicted nucleotidyltransferase